MMTMPSLILPPSPVRQRHLAKRTLRAEEIVRHFAPRRTRLYILIRFAFRRVIDPLAHAAPHHGTEIGGRGRGTGAVLWFRRCRCFSNRQRRGPLASDVATVLAAQLQRVDIRAPFGQAQRHLKAGILQAGGQAVYRAAAQPCEPKALARLLRKRSPVIFHQPGDFRHHHVVHGGRADKYAFRAENIGEDVVLSLRATLKIFTATRGSTSVIRQWRPPSCGYYWTWCRRRW